MGLYSKADIEKSKEQADKFIEEVEEKQKKDAKTKSTMDWALFFVYVGFTGISICLVFLVIKALLKYIGS